MDGRCATCRRWDRFDDFGGRCMLTLSDENGDAVHTESLAVALHSPEWGPDEAAFLRTDPDFGCVQWEAR